MVEAKKARNVFRLGSGQQDGDDGECAAILSFLNLPNDCKLDFSFLVRAESMLAESPNVYFLVTCTGSFDLIAFLIFRDASELDKFMREKVARLPGIKGTQTFVNMNVAKSPWQNQIDITQLLES